MQYVIAYSGVVDPETGEILHKTLKNIAAQAPNPAVGSVNETRYDVAEIRG